MSKLGVWKKIIQDLIKTNRIQGGCNEHPSLLIIDAQSLKTTGKAEQRGFDGGKKVKSRKRQIVVDTHGNMHEVFVHKANIHDSKRGAVLADIVLKEQKSVKKMLADLGYREFFEEVVRVIHKQSVEFSRKIVGEFRIQPKHWVLERTIAWFNWSRGLSKDFEQKYIYSENIICIAAIDLTLRQIY